MITTDLHKIVIKDIIGSVIKVGDTLQLFRGVTVRKLSGTNNTAQMITPAVWIHGILKLDTDKGLVVEVLDLYHPNGIKPNETEPVKIGWHIKANTHKYCFLAAPMFIKNAETLETIYTYATASGRAKMNKNRLKLWNAKESKSL